MIASSIQIKIKFKKQQKFKEIVWSIVWLT